VEFGCALRQLFVVCAPDFVSLVISSACILVSYFCMVVRIEIMLGCWKKSRDVPVVQPSASFPTAQ